jgi:hypothetical protein
MQLIFTQEPAALPLKTVSSMELSSEPCYKVYTIPASPAPATIIIVTGISPFYLAKYTMMFCEKLGDGH